MSPWRAAPRGAPSPAPRTQTPVGTMMPQDGPRSAGLDGRGSGALVLQTQNFKDGAPQGQLRKAERPPERCGQIAALRCFQG